MGAWGVLPFENDNAVDWIWNLEEAVDTSVLTDALEAVGSAGALDGDCEEAVAAAEVVAALRGKPLTELPDEVTDFLRAQRKQKPPTKLVNLAITVVQRIAEASDLKDRWDRSDRGKTWQEAMKDLLLRLEE
jgi:hypothetical protein